MKCKRRPYVKAWHLQIREQGLTVTRACCILGNLRLAGVGFTRSSLLGDFRKLHLLSLSSISSSHLSSSQSLPSECCSVRTPLLAELYHVLCMFLRS